jgi:hypothetical protein
MSRPIMTEGDAHRRHVVCAALGVIRGARLDLHGARQRGDRESIARCTGRVIGALAIARQFRERRVG